MPRPPCGLQVQLEPYRVGRVKGLVGPAFKRQETVVDALLDVGAQPAAKVESVEEKLLVGQEAAALFAAYHGVAPEATWLGRDHPDGGLRQTVGEVAPPHHQVLSQEEP